MTDISDETLDEVEQALTPFSVAWAIALSSAAPNKATMGEIGAIAAHHVPASDFRSASNALARLRTERRK